MQKERTWPIERDLNRNRTPSKPESIAATISPSFPLFPPPPTLEEVMLVKEWPLHIAGYRCQRVALFATVAQERT